jgi:hypothetical protein
MLWLGQLVEVEVEVEVDMCLLRLFVTLLVYSSIILSLKALLFLDKDIG